MTEQRDDLTDFVLARLSEDERRFEDGVLPHLDDAERRGRIRIMRTDDGSGLLLAEGPLEAREERAPVPFPEKLAFLRRELGAQRDDDTARLLASVYAGHPDWQPHWQA